MQPAMSEAANVPAVAAAKLPARKPKPLQVTPKVAKALSRMVELGETYQDAAAAVGLHIRAMRKALDKPHVLSELRKRKQVFREAVSAQNIHRLAELRDASGNAMAKLGAIKVLEQIGDDPQHQAARQSMPGFNLVIVNRIEQPANKPTISTVVERSDD